MSPDKWLSLEEEQRITLLIAMHIRNELEDFHVRHLPDRTMAELNSTIRYAIYDYLTTMDANEMAWLSMMVPDYWEVPGDVPKPEFTGENPLEGKLE